VAGSAAGSAAADAGWDAGWDDGWEDGWDDGCDGSDTVGSFGGGPAFVRLVASLVDRPGPDR
jgi:hypothetical protein